MVRIDHKKAVKKYQRSSAGNEAPLPEDVRPPPILRQTMDYLLDYIIGQEPSSLEVKQKFVRDRTRSIRQDSVLQQQYILGSEINLAVVVKIHEEIARFHIVIGHRLCQASIEDFDPFQNTEQLRKVLQSLHEYYSDCRHSFGSNSSILINEPEFRAYQLLTHAEDQDVVRQSLSFDAKVFSSLPVQFALDCVSAFHQGDYVRFFRLVTKSTYAQACLLHTHFNKVRLDAIKRIQKSFMRGSQLPAADLARWLFVHDYSELVDFGESASFRIEISPSDSNLPVVIFFDSAPDLEVSTKLNPRISFIIEKKVDGIPLSQIIRGVCCSLVTKPFPGEPHALLPSLEPPIQKLPVESQTPLYLKSTCVDAKFAAQNQTKSFNSPSSSNGSTGGVILHGPNAGVTSSNFKRSVIDKVKVSSIVAEKFIEEIVGQHVHQVISNVINLNEKKQARVYKQRVIDTASEKILDWMIEDLLKPKILIWSESFNRNRRVMKKVCESIFSTLYTEIISNITEKICHQVIQHTIEMEACRRREIMIRYEKALEKVLPSHQSTKTETKSFPNDNILRPIPSIEEIFESNRVQSNLIQDPTTIEGVLSSKGQLVDCLADISRQEYMANLVMEDLLRRALNS